MPIKNNGKCEVGVTAGRAGVCRTPSSLEGWAAADGPSSGSVGPKSHHPLKVGEQPQYRWEMNAELLFGYAVVPASSWWFAVGISSLGLGSDPIK